MEKKTDIPLMVTAAVAAAGLGLADVLDVAKCTLKPNTCTFALKDIAIVSQASTTATNIQVIAWPPASAISDTGDA
ncbi:MAG TPA: hypothetical protein VH852_04190 [Hyphomicrobium sp.]|jgi:hypothetical protein